MITSRRVIARASRCTRRSICSIVRLYSTARTSLNVYALDISYVYDTKVEGIWRIARSGANMPLPNPHKAAQVVGRGIQWINPMTDY